MARNFIFVYIFKLKVLRKFSDFFFVSFVCFIGQIYYSDQLYSSREQFLRFFLNNFNFLN